MQKPCTLQLCPHPRSLTDVTKAHLYSLCAQTHSLIIFECLSLLNCVENKRWSYKLKLQCSRSTYVASLAGVPWVHWAVFTCLKLFFLLLLTAINSQGPIFKLTDSSTCSGSLPNPSSDVSISGTLYFSALDFLLCILLCFLIPDGYFHLIHASLS